MTLTDQQIDNLLNKVDEHNKGKNFENSYYIIDLTGDKRVYFTLYRYDKPISGYVNPYKYIKNISIDFEKVIDKVIGRLHLPILACYDDNNSPLLIGFRKRTKEGVPTLPFGKYRGETLEQVWDKDRGYILWFNKNYKKDGKYKLTEEDVILLDQSNELVNIFFEEISEKNRKECTSEFIELKKRMDFDITITKIGNGKVYGENEDGNIIYFYYEGNDFEVGQKLTVVGRTTKHVEVLGRKTTYINRIKIKGLDN
ncbi:MAG: hypothetical protein ACOC3V_04305 [bacterium]